MAILAVLFPTGSASSTPWSAAIVSAAFSPIAIDRALATLLDRGAGYRSVGAEYAAIAWQRAQEGFASGALVEEEAGISRHRLGFRRTAARAGDRRFEGHRHRSGVDDAQHHQNR